MDNRTQWLAAQLNSVDGHHPREGIAKHLKMATSPFVFFRGSSQLFYADIKTGQLAFPSELYEIPQTTIMGDCHTSNFGFFTEEGSHSDTVIFAPNDFDDACIGHSIWDVSRFCVSLALAADHGRRLVTGELPHDKTLTEKPYVAEEDVVQAIRAFITSYVESCELSIGDRFFLQHALTDFPKSHILHKHYFKAAQRTAGGELFTEKSALGKAVNESTPPLAFADIEKFKRLNSSLYDEIEETFLPYVDDSILDIVSRQNAGTGSVNMDRYYLLVGPADYAGKQDLGFCHIVEVKQQRPAAPLYHFLDLSPVNQLNPAHLTVNCQRRMQRNPDLVLDEVEWQGYHWLVRSRHHAKVGIDPEDITIGKKAVNKGGFVEYAKTCGTALALAHCRGDRRSTFFEQAVATRYMKNLDLLTDTCIEYCAQVKHDTYKLNKLIKQG